MSLPLSVSRCPHFLMMERFYLPRDQQNWLLLLSQDEPEQLSHWCSQNLWTFCWYCFMLSAPCFCAYKMHSYPSIRSSCCRCCFIQGPSFLNMNLFKSHLTPEHFFGYCDLTLDLPKNTELDLKSSFRSHSWKQNSLAWQNSHIENEYLEKCKMYILLHLHSLTSMLYHLCLYIPQS